MNDNMHNTANPTDVRVADELALADVVDVMVPPPKPMVAVVAADTLRVVELDDVVVVVDGAHSERSPSGYW